MIPVLGYEIPQKYIFSIIGGIIGYFLSRLNIRYRIRRQARMNAAIEFRNAFTDAIVLLSSGFLNDTSADTIVNEALTKHRAAFLKFKTYLPRLKRICLQKAWDKYCCKKEYDIWQKELGEYSEEPGIACYDARRDANYQEIEWKMENEFNMRKLALKRVEKMLKIV